MELNRRDFFRFGFRGAARMAGEAVAGKLGLDQPGCIRPPFALAEPAFLEACTSCDACIEACAYDIIFKLPDDIGGARAGTPVLDLGVSGCHLCDHWPCVQVCEPGALKLPEADEDAPPSWPKLADAAINTQTCLPYAGPECGACQHACPVPGALNWENGIKPVIDNQVCTGCELCREACITDPKSIDITAVPAPNPDRG